MKLDNQTEMFVMHFGEMGSRWGFSRTIGQMLALIVITPESLNADDISETLKISRGNVSMALKELQSWRLVKLVHKAGDRKDYFVAAGSIWDLAKTVFEERSKREVDPTLSMLRGALLETPEDEAAQYSQQKMQEIHDLLELLTQWAHTLNDMTPEKLQTLMKLGSGVVKLLDMKNKITGK
ncbi:MAG: GbsR/MarR family transcriptional regulator [Gammaproteobacteria bacterium]|nr:GbsR/MarR family transcriptional regulator [Gammaproteobacteria bacterium]